MLICIHGMLIDMYHHKVKARRVTLNLPASLLEDAQKVTGSGITETVVRGLWHVKRSNALKKLQALRGKIRLDIDLETSRERRH